MAGGGMDAAGQQGTGSSMPQGFNGAVSAGGMPRPPAAPAQQQGFNNGVLGTAGPVSMGGMQDSRSLSPDQAAQQFAAAQAASQQAQLGMQQFQQQSNPFGVQNAPSFNGLNQQPSSASFGGPSTMNAAQQTQQAQQQGPALSSNNMMGSNGAGLPPQQQQQQPSSASFGGPSTMNAAQQTQQAQQQGGLNSLMARAQQYRQQAVAQQRAQQMYQPQRYGSFAQRSTGMPAMQAAGPALSSNNMMGSNGAGLPPGRMARGGSVRYMADGGATSPAAKQFYQPIYRPQYTDYRRGAGTPVGATPPGEQGDVYTHQYTSGGQQQTMPLYRTDQTPPQGFRPGMTAPISSPITLDSTGKPIDPNAAAKAAAAAQAQQPDVDPGGAGGGGYARGGITTLMRRRRK